MQWERRGDGSVWGLGLHLGCGTHPIWKGAPQRLPPLVSIGLSLPRRSTALFGGQDQTGEQALLQITEC